MMARNKFALCCALRHIFFNDYGLEKTFIMSDLLALTAYYSDQDTPPEIISNQKKLHQSECDAAICQEQGVGVRRSCLTAYQGRQR